MLVKAVQGQVLILIRNMLINLLITIGVKLTRKLKERVKRKKDLPNKSLRRILWIKLTMISL